MLMADLLGQSGFTVHMAGSGAAGVAAVREHNPVVVTVDLGLPDFDGYEVTRQVRQFSDAYVVMLTARTEEIDTLMGLEAGADDYINKPFRPRELRARIDAMLRRPRSGGPSSTAPDAATPSSPTIASAPVMSGAAPATVAASPASPAETGSVPEGPTAHAHSVAHARLELDGLALYPHLHHVEAAGREVPLTPTEFQLLEMLLRSGRVVRSKAELARTLRGDDADGGTFVSKSDERTIEVHVGNLRRKLADDPNAPRWIQTVRGVGYRMTGRTVAIS